MTLKWTPSFAELIDRLSIHQLKEVFISEHKDKYASEMGDIVHDIDLLINKYDIKISGKLIHAIVAMAQINHHIWNNESQARLGEKQNTELLVLTHGLNGLRNKLMNLILTLIDQTDRMDYKVDCLGAEFDDWKINLLSE